MLRLRGKAVDEEQKDSGEEQRDEDEGLGPRSNVSLLDQHQHLKEKAEGIQFKRDPFRVVIIRLNSFHTTACLALSQAFSFIYSSRFTDTVCFCLYSP